MASQVPLRIGLTGGIASGKSAAADMFAALGVPVIDTDVIAREIVAPGQPGLAAVVQEFGAGCLRADGSLDRETMRDKVFAEQETRKRLETILHPLIRAATISAMQAEGGSYQIIVVPLLVETNFASLVDRILVIDCPPEVQVARLAARDNETPETARAMLSAQATRAERLAIADDVIVNAGTRTDLQEAVNALHERYLKLALGD